MFRYSSAFLVTLALTLGPAPEARADNDAVAGFIVGLGVGAIAGAAAQKNSQKKKTTTTSRKKTYAKSTSNAKRGDAQVQVALNYYNFEAGTPDGVFGPGTRAAVRRYQTYIGQPVTGDLTSAETTALLSAYARDTAGASDGLFAGNRTSTGNSQMSTLLASLGSQGTNDLAPAMPATAVATTTEAAALPMAAAPTPDDLCKAPLTAPAKGPGAASPADTIVDSYCSAVGYAVQNSVTLSKAVQGFDPAVSGKQCADWLVANRAKLDSALAKEPEAAVADLAALVPGAAGAQKVAMRDSFSICQGIAQAAGNVQDARGFAALVASFGGAGYGELVAASDALGLGTAQSGKSANAWYLWTAEAVDGGGAKLITAADYDHVPLLLALADSSLEMTGDWQTYLAAANAPAPAGGLALPGLSNVATTTPQLPGLATESAVPDSFQQTYGMTQDQALAACRQGGAAMADLGRITCRSIAVSAGDSLLAAQYQ